MRFRAELKPLASAAAAAAKIAETRQMIPILTHAKVEAFADGTVRLTATDYDREITITVPADVEAPGAVVIQAARFSDALSAARPGAEVFLCREADAATLRTGRTRYTLPMLPPEDFPAIGEVAEFPPSIKLPGKIFAETLRRTSHAASVDKTRNYLNGVLFDGRPDGLRLVASDGFRLMRSDLGGTPNVRSVILPCDSVPAFVRLAEGVEEVELEISDRLARLSGGSQRILTKLVEGTFPDYDRLTPSDFKFCAHLDADEFASALKRVHIGTDSERPWLELVFARDGLKLEAKGQAGLRATDQIDCECDFELRVGFVGKKLVEAMENLDAERIRFETNGPTGPSKLSAPLKPGSFVCVMPQRI
jgi:DNA polymerase III subunit beta